MPLSDLTDPIAVVTATQEFDALGRDAFLRKHGFGPSRIYFLRHEGKLYDSKAIVGVAYGIQHPNEGPLRSTEFSGGEDTVRTLLERLGFAVEMRGQAALTITAQDIELMRQSRSRIKYTDFSDEERAAHQHVHTVLTQLGQMVVDELGGTRDYVLKLTSGFHPASGIRGGKPKDLWFGVYRRENETRFLGNPQVFMIVSGRGIEYGFSPLTHPDDFSNQDIKRQTREIARSVLTQLPIPRSNEANALADQLSNTGHWYFRRKQRLDPNQSEYQSLDDWLAFVQSEDGIRNAGGGIVRYALANAVDGVVLADEVRQMAKIFRPLMEHVVADAPPAAARLVETAPAPVIVPDDANVLNFADLLRTFLRELAAARSDLQGSLQGREDNDQSGRGYRKASQS